MLGPGEADLVRVRAGAGAKRETVSGGCETLRVRRSGSREVLRVRAMVCYWLSMVLAVRSSCERWSFGGGAGCDGEVMGDAMDR